ncbi:MAG: aminotransferase class I/II-fold pyridoxal phosphate-dependent enzyme [Lachnospiraceae bacterium]
MKKPIYDALLAYRDENRYPFHMPGHKRNMAGHAFSDAYAFDITEVDGMDDLHMPEGVIRESMDIAKTIYGTKETYYLVNGSSCGLLAAISCSCHPGDSILVSRNCHKSVHNAIALLHLRPVYWQEGEDLPEEDITAIVITSPNYEGVLTDLTSIVEWKQTHSACLIVDEAHGAHFPFSKAFPDSAIERGADIVVQSVHKTLPSLTQTAVLHVCTDGVSLERLQYYLSVYQSSSPSYLLMASIEYCIVYCAEHPEMFEAYVELLKEYREKLKQCHRIRLAEWHGKESDISRLVLQVLPYRKKTDRSIVTGLQLAEILRHQYQIETEMSERDYVVLISTVFDTREGFERLYRALLEIDAMFEAEMEEGQVPEQIQIGSYPKAEQVMLPGDVIQHRREYLLYQQASGRICADYIYIYPPGIPILCPGEKIDDELIAFITQYVENGFTVRGLEDKQIAVLCREE